MKNALVAFLFLFPSVFALGGEAGQPEVNIFGGIADDSSLIAVGIIDPNPLSDEFIPLDEPLLGVVHTNDLWFAVYVPDGVHKEELDFKVDYWREREQVVTRELSDGTIETTTEIVKYDMTNNGVITIPVRHHLYLETGVIKNHGNLTHVRITYQNLEWEFLHQSSKSAVSISWVRNLGDVWFLYLKATFITMIIALISFGIGGWVFDKVRYVPPLSLLETGLAGFFLIMLLGASYGWLEYHAMNYEWYIIQLPVMGIVTFLSLQYFKPDKRRVLGIRVPPQKEGPNIELAMSAPLIVRDKKSDTVNNDLLVHRWSWRNVLYRLLSGGPKVVYETHQKFYTKDINKIFDEVYMLHPDNPPCFEYPHLERKSVEIDKDGMIGLLGCVVLAIIVYYIGGVVPFILVFVGGVIVLHSYVPIQLNKGVAVMYLAPVYEKDKIEHMCGLDIINDNNDAREKAEKESYELKVRIQSKATEKAKAFMDVITSELFGKEKEEVKEEEPQEEKSVKEVEEVIDELKKKEEKNNDRS